MDTEAAIVPEAGADQYVTLMSLSKGETAASGMTPGLTWVLLGLYRSHAHVNPV